eukprot:s2954_g3.t1
MASSIFGSLHPAPGERIAGVFNVLHKIEENLFSCTRVPGDFPVLIGGADLPLGKLSLYDVEVNSIDDVMVLSFTDETWWHPLWGDEALLSPNVIDLCAGTGSMSLGTKFLGANPMLAVDWNPAAVAHLIANHKGKVLHLDITTIDAAKRIHQECIDRPGQNEEIRSALDSLAAAMGWVILTTELDLLDVWPCKRHRWWALLMPQSWNQIGLAPWTLTTPFDHIGAVLPAWGCWPAEAELALLLTPNELEKFHDTRYGHDVRHLTLAHTAATILHSYASALGPCPCGCRLRAFHDLTLQKGGLRGFYVTSSTTDRPRFLHPREAGLLLGLPDTVDYPNEVKTSLALLGLVASPLQAIWIYSHLQLNYHLSRQLGPYPRPVDWLEAYIKELFAQLHIDFGIHTAVPRSISSQADGHPLMVPLGIGFNTIQMLLQAERISLRWNEGCELQLHGQRLGHLVDLSTLVNCELQFACFSGPVDREPPSQQVVIAVQHQDLLQVHLVHPGCFLFEILATMNLPLIRKVVTTEGQILPVDFRIWRPMAVKTLTTAPWIQLPGFFRCANGFDSKAHLGLHDGQIWAGILDLLHTSSTERHEVFAVHPALAPALLHHWISPVHQHQLQAGYAASSGDIVCIFETHGHWTLIYGRKQASALHWTFCDGLHMECTIEAHQLAFVITQLLGLDFCPPTAFCVIPQIDRFTCGTIALAHLFLLRNPGLMIPSWAVRRLHYWICAQPSLQGSIFAQGPADLSPDQLAKLASLLKEHGVPESKVPERVQQVLHKLGAPAIIAAFVAKNSWAHLKLAANKPGVAFRLVTPDELARHAEQQANRKYGVGIKDHKTKKKVDKTPASIPQLDPVALQLHPGHFKDENGENVPQIQFQDLQVEAHGIAIASLQQCQHWLQHHDSISTAALAILLLEELPAEKLTQFGMTKLSFPATYKGTGEPVLIFGCLKNLGDKKINRHVVGATTKIDIVNTIVVRLHVYRDELQASWQDLTQSPVRLLSTLVPQLQLCAGDGCGPDCLKSHAAVGESLDSVIMEVWGRSFGKSEGGRAPADVATYFSVFLRIPDSILKPLLQANVQGIYFDHRCDRAPDDRFRVIWLPAHTLAEALHACKTCIKALGLVRLRHKYGLRVAAADEEAAFKQLKPEATFIATRVQRTFQVFPLPHGLQRAGLIRILSDLQWVAKPLQPAFHLPFAEQNVHSAASPDDCEFRSGALESLDTHGLQFESPHDLLWGYGQFSSCFSTATPRIGNFANRFDLGFGHSDLFHGDGLNGQRLGEATHPGPDGLLTIGTTNPSGLRNKEQLAIEQGDGIWSYCETQLSTVTQRSTTKALKYFASQEGRHLRVHCGAPAALRSRSTWAGTWTGVACTSDFSSKILQTPWPEEVWASGRVLATQHYVGSQVITVVTVYGLPRGPTWPRAAALTNDILAYITREFVVGYSGIVIINGDFNFSPHELPCFDVWRAYGYQSAQEYAHQCWSQPREATCKGATERDHVWMSPMVISFCRKVGVEAVFQDHSSVYIQLQIEALPTTLKTWPRPREIPWQQVDLDAWHSHCDGIDLSASADPTQTMQELASSFEKSLTGFVQDVPTGSLSTAHCGRAQRLQPATQSPTPRTCRASRPGEAHLVADTVGQAVLQWFRQLRRLQSFRHAICAGHMHHSAVQYRIELWSAIRRARGFDGSFTDWWSHQEFAQALGPLPQSPPDADQAILIYQAFHHEFRSFERWHLQQRQKILQAKYDKTMKALFQDLRKPRPDQVDSFWDTLSFEVIAIKPATNCLLLNRPIPDLPAGQWFFQGQPLSVRGFEEELLVLDFLPDCSVGDCLDLHHHTVTIDQVHQNLIDFWSPKWNCEALQSAETWSRMTSFVQAYMPKLPLSLPPLTIDAWRKALRRFKPTAARGADGWARLDLINMSTFHTNQLLLLLTAIEQQQVSWPAQLLEGLVIALAKCESAHRPNEYRPIALLSIVYRNWASLRSRQLLRQLEQYIHADTHGFLPSREPAQTWLHLQSAIETSLQSAQPLAGIGTDIVKAFNCIQRDPLWHLATAIGVPAALLWPWKEFVSKSTRRFMVCNQVSEAVLSTQGFAEGCPLSVLAMALVDWSYQMYQAQYAPQVRHLSFVDNISMLARQAELVAWAFFTLRTFLSMWGLTLDLAKTYAWGTTTSIRRQLAQLGLRIVEDFSELGGALSFTAAHRVRNFVQRSESLHEKWPRLRRSKAPTSQQLQALPMVFWSKALHGTLSCVAAERHVHKLRTQAVKFLGLQLAGSNPVLRLSLAQPTTADPGFYQLKTALTDFQRLCQKSPDILQFWRIYMSRFDGSASDGPFFKLITLLSDVGWRVLEPPWLQDHDGFSFDLLTMPKRALHLLLYDAWMQHIATRTQHKTMTGLNGLDPELTLLDHHTLDAIDLARVRALQTGAFISSWQHAKYDKTKQPICQLCLQPDTQKPWLRCPRFAAQRTECGDSLHWLDDAPSCLQLHLLAPRSPYAQSLKQFLEIPDVSRVFLSTPRTGQLNHVFTDGSFFKGLSKLTSRASWAVVNSSTGQPVSHGLVPGLLQTIGRAELWACLSAVEWSIKFDVDIIIWTDSASTCSHANHLLHTGWLHDDCENADLWRRLVDLFAQLRPEQIEIRWIPSHIDYALCDDVCEEFLAVWNDVVDQQAVHTNLQRGPTFAELLQQAEAHHALWRKRLQALRTFYLGVAKTRQDEPELIDLTDDADALTLRVSDLSLGDALAVNWQSQLQFHASSLAMPLEFVSFLVHSCIHVEPLQLNFVAISFVELTLWFVHCLNAQFPVEKATTGQWICRSPADMLLKPTATFLTQKIRSDLKEGLKLLGLEQYLCVGLNRQVSNIVIPVDGILLSLPAAVQTEICHLSHSFFPRQLRKAADVARPCV